MKKIVIGFSIFTIALNLINAETSQNSLATNDQTTFANEKQSDKQNLPKALYITGLSYEKRMGVKKNIQTALGYYIRAADMGENRALARIKQDPLLQKDLELRIKGIDAVRTGDYQSAIQYFQQSIPHREKVLGKENLSVAATYDSIGRFYDEMGDNTKALIYYQRALAIKEKILGEKHSNTALSYDNISFLYERTRNYSDALEYAKKALSIQEKTLSTDLRSAYNYARIGWLYEKVGDYPNALRYEQKTLAIQEEILGKDHNETIRSYINLSFIFSKIGNYPKALEYAEKALPIHKKFLDKESQIATMKYDRISWLYQKTGDYPNAIKYTKKALGIQKGTLGKEHINTARTYDQLSFLYQLMKNYPAALEYAQKAVEIQEKVLKPESKETMNSYENLSYLYREIGNFPKAMAYTQKALDMKEKVWGKGDINTIKNYSDLGSIYQSMQDYFNALIIEKKVLKLRKKYLPMEDKDIVWSYNNLSFIYSQLGKYSAALEYAQKALDITKTTFGEASVNTANSYARLGLINQWIGDYSKALQYQKKALKIKEEILGKTHEDIAGNYIGLGLIYQQLRDYSKALANYQKALVINEKIFGNKNLATASSYVSLGSLYSLIGDHSKALKYNQKALLSTETVSGKNHTDTAVAYLQVAFSYQALKYYPKASEYYHKALNINEKILGTESTAVASIYAGLGSLYDDMGDYAQSLTYHQKALSITEANFGKNHMITSINYSLVGSIYQEMGDFPEAHHYAQLAFDTFLINRDKTFSILDSKQKEKYLKSTSGYIALLLKNSYAYMKQLKKEGKTKKAKEILHSGANAWLNYKGCIFNSENTIAMLYSSTKDQKLKVKIDDLVSSKRYLAKLYQSLPKPKEKEAWQKNIKNTEEKIGKLTNEIANKASALKELQSLKNITYKDITSKLKENELYIDYAKAKDIYYFFTLDHNNKITFAPLGDDAHSTKKIDTLVKAFKEDITAIIEDNNITDEKLNTLTQSSKKTLSKLYNLIIKKPLRDAVKNKTSLIISPDGALRLLPFETLFDKENGKYLIEEKEIRYIPSGKELIRLYKYSKDKKSKTAKSTVIFANPNFNTKIASVSKEKIALTPNTNRSGIIKSLFRMRFSPLPGTEAEANEIKEILKGTKVTEYEKSEATESALMKTKEPKMLHIATHGFFINDNTIPNPMLKSGIALAGANASAIRGKSDGIVTALKLSGLNLKGTDLVVLSACETGVVDINSTDSISGLSKAFIQAGAKDIVMSLWSVDDEATKELMTFFYQEMKENKNYAKALKAAKLKMVIEGKHPFYWGAFVVSGL